MCKFHDIIKIFFFLTIYHIMKYCYKSGFDKFHLALGYKGDQIKKWFMDYPLMQSFQYDARSKLSWGSQSTLEQPN